MCPELARSEGFEPPTPKFEVWCSIQLSYERASGIGSGSDIARLNRLEAELSYRVTRI